MKKRNLLITAAATVLLIGGTMVYAAPRNTVDPYQKSLSSQLETNESSSVALLTKAEAEAIALTHAGLKVNQVTNLRSEYDWDNRVKYYDIEFRSGDYEYDYEVHAETGVVLSWDKDYDKVQTSLAAPETENKTDSKSEAKSENKTESKSESKAESKTESKPKTESKATLLTNAEAESIAIAHAGLNAKNVTHLKSEYDVDDGVKHYDIEFRSGDYEYDYEVNAESGTVISWDKEYEKSSKTTNKTEPKPESKPAETKTESEHKTESKATLLTNAEAESIAIAHAGLNAKDVTRLKSEFDVDDGVKQYDIEFRSGDYEYDYEVNAESGKVISWDKEYEKSGKTTNKTETKTESKPAETKTESKPAETTLLTNAEAESIAISHAGLNAKDVTRLKSEFDVDDGVKQYDIEFRSGKYEYEYEIHAETGAVISWDKEIDD